MRRPAPPPQAPPRSSAPAPAAARPSAPPPAPVQQGGGGGGMMSGLLGTVFQGAALGTGSAMAHRAMDSVMGPRTVVHEHQGQEAGGAPAPASSAMAAGGAQGPCAAQAVKFAECVSATNGDMTACEYYLSALQSCKLNSAGFQQA
jgi:coiled-coil-helix-coiled-coil-helix domain-containing protein 10